MTKLLTNLQAPKIGDSCVRRLEFSVRGHEPAWTP